MHKPRGRAPRGWASMGLAEVGKGEGRSKQGHKGSGHTFSIFLSIFAIPKATLAGSVGAPRKSPSLKEKGGATVVGWYKALK